MHVPARLLFVVVVFAVLAPRASAQCKFTATFTECYAPDEVTEPHPSHELTIFLPLVAPPPDGGGLYPTILYSPAGVFAQTTEGQNFTLEDLFGEQEPLDEVGFGLPAGGPLYAPATPNGTPPLTGTEAAVAFGCGFLDTALHNGWAVVTVGSTGWNSWPTCSQINDCNECLNTTTGNPMCMGTATCQDTNIWYPPGSAAWDDFDVQSGEKEFTWARQWIGLNGSAFCLDTNRVVACGTSTGAIYAAFLAFGPNHAWDATHSLQAQEDTRIAGMVAFESGTWLKALSSTQPAVHWASSTDPGMNCMTAGLTCGGTAEECYNRRATILFDAITPDGSVAPGLLEESSMSRWVRAIEGDEVDTPVFIVHGDGFFTTGFARDANLPAFAEDYFRHMSPAAIDCGVSMGDPTLISGDPVLKFTEPPDQINLHDSWFAVNFMIDLLTLDDVVGNTFHATRSRLYLQEGHDWSKLPSCLSTTGFAPTTAAEVSILSGTFKDAGILQSLDNADSAPLVVDWMEAMLGIQRGNGVATRNPALVGPNQDPNTNPDVFTSTTPFQGLPIPVEIDLNLTDYEEANILFFTERYDPGFELVLGGGQALLCDLLEVLDFTTGFLTADPDGVVRTDLGAASPGGIEFCLQALLKDTDQQVTFALTNAVDLTVQSVP